MEGRLALTVVSVRSLIYASHLQPNGLRAFDGRTPANLDLFLAIDQEITVIERERDVRIGFWHVPRKYNAIADKLAKEAARCAPATSQLPNANEGPSRFY